MTEHGTSEPAGRGRLIAFLLGIVVVGALGASVLMKGGDEPASVEVSVPTGTTFTAALERTITTEGGEVGAPVRLKTVNPLDLETGHVIPAGSVIRGEVTHTQGGGRVAGAPELTIRFTEISFGGNDYRIDTEPFRLKGKDDLKESVAEIGGGAVVGGIVGAVTGAGTVEGAAVGAVLGTGVAVATKGNQIVLPAGQQLRVKLAEPLALTLPALPSGS